MALRDTARTDATLAAMNPEHYRLAARFDTVPAVILELRTKAAAEALASHENVAAVELDSGGFGLFAGPVPVQKVARIAVFDTGLPDVEKLNSTEKLAGEQCFCKTAYGAGCCPDGSVRQEGLGAARESLPFATSSLAWLKIPDEAPKEIQRYVTWEPFVSVYKVIPRGDAFDSWESVFRAVDALDASSEYSRQDVVLFSLASAKLYTGPCDRGGSALEIAWGSILKHMAEKRITILLPAARGGPGPGVALPGCFEFVAGAERLSSNERYPVPNAPSGPGSGIGIGAPGNGGPPPAPVRRNASVGLGVVESIRAALPEERPMVDTLPGQEFSVIKVRVRDVRAAREDIPSLLESGKTVDFLTLETPGFTAGAEVKFSATLTGFEGQSSWYAEAWRPVVTNIPAAANPALRAR